MRLSRWAWTLLLLAGLPASAADLAIVNARLLASPEATPVESATVLVHDGRIVAAGPGDTVTVPAGTPRLDAKGGTLAAGFWNSHVHFLAPPLGEARTQPAPALEAALRDMLMRWGFTTVFDLAGFKGNAAALEARIEAGELAGPQILQVDAPFFPEGGTPIYVRDLLERMGAPSAEVATPEAAAERARAQLAGGADGVKLFVGAILGRGQVKHLDAGIVRAVTDAARAAGKPSFAHPTDPEGMAIAVDNGVDVLVHPLSVGGAWDDATLRRLREADVALMPTLTLFEWELGRDGAPPAVTARFVADAVTQVRAFHAAGGTLLFGTDIGYTDHADTRREFELLGQAGLDWRAVLASLTTTPARRFGQDGERGRIAPGQAADLVLLGGDPTADLRAFADVAATVRAGRVVFRRDEGGDAR